MKTPRLSTNAEDCSNQHPPRREFLKRTGLSMVGIGAGNLLLSSGCVEEQEASPIKVGILHSQTGTMAISETSLRDIELFAIEEINAAGGLLGRKDQTSRRGSALAES